jgi:hypothetical protein
MLPLTVATAARPTNASPWIAFLYAAVATSIAAVATSLLFTAEILILYLLAFLLIGAGPVVGYLLATGQLGSDWRPIIGGILSFILLPLGWLLWPVLVGAMSRQHSIGRLLLATILGIIVGIVLFLISVTAIGQNPYTIWLSFTLLCVGWGGTCGALMTVWRNA